MEKHKKCIKIIKKIVKISSFPVGYYLWGTAWGRNFRLCEN
jgi:hypothetical protein